MKCPDNERQVTSAYSATAAVLTRIIDVRLSDTAASRLFTQVEEMGVAPAPC